MICSYQKGDQQQDLSTHVDTICQMSRKPAVLVKSRFLLLPIISLSTIACVPFRMAKEYENVRTTYQGIR
jgi:hypothetical protein